MHYLVFPTEATRNGTIRRSEHFPTIVSTGEFVAWEFNDATSILCTVFKDEPFEPANRKQYTIVPVHSDAIVAMFKKVRPKPVPKDYVVETRPF